MPQINHQQTIYAPIELVYQISQDYAVRYDWDEFPDFIRNLDNEGGMPFVGREVEVRSKLGMTMRVRFVKVKPPECAAVKMFQASFLFNSLQVVGYFRQLMKRKRWCVFVIRFLRLSGVHGS